MRLNVSALVAFFSAAAVFGGASSLYTTEDGSLPKWELYVPPKDGSDELLKSQAYAPLPYSEVDFPESPTAASSAGGSYDANVAMNALWYSKTAYCPAANVNSWSCPTCSFHPKVSNVKVYTYFDLQAFVGYNQQLRQIVVAFRGSSNLANWISNLAFFKRPYPPCDGTCNVHIGFHDLWNGLRPQMVDAVRSLTTVFPGSSLLVTGHSLGGAISLLAALDLHASMTNIRDFYFYNFGMPRVGDDGFAAYAARTLPNGRQYRVVHKRDLVPHLPALIMGFRHAPQEVFYENDGSTSWVECNDSAAGEDSKCSNQYYVTASVADHLNYLGLSTNCVV